MIVGVIAALAAVAAAAIGVALWRSARGGTGVWWPLAVVALVFSGLYFAVIRLGFT